MNVENYFIRLFQNPNTVIGDDGAIKGSYVYSKDLFFENVHFKRSWLTPYQIGYKAMIVNISDAIAMNAIPKYALLGVGMPKTFSLNEMEELSRGIKDAAQHYGIEIIGGDTIANAKLDISITIISALEEKPLTRYGIKNGDIIAYTGTIGKSKRQLHYLFANGSVHHKHRFVKPTLRADFIRGSSRYLRAGMDISDGLFSDLQKICSLNKKSASLNKKISKSHGCSGEEYEMLVVYSPRNAYAVQCQARRARTSLNTIGFVRNGKFINRCKAHHF